MPTADQRIRAGSGPDGELRQDLWIEALVAEPAIAKGDVERQEYYEEDEGGRCLVAGSRHQQRREEHDSAGPEDEHEGWCQFHPIPEPSDISIAR